MIQTQIFVGSMKKKAKNIILDLACGANRHPEANVGVDIAKCNGVDIVADLNKYPWKWAKSNWADKVYISHYIEHVPDLMKFMDQLYRIMKKGAQCHIVAPYYSSMRCWQDPTHVRAISEATFLYFNKDWRVQNKLDHYPINTDFDFTYGFSLHPDFVQRNEEMKMFAIAHYINAVTDIQVTLTKK